MPLISSLNVRESQKLHLIPDSRFSLPSAGDSLIICLAWSGRWGKQPHEPTPSFPASAFSWGGAIRSL